jgi:CDP-glucose 4,6-dehydratase
MTALLKRLGCDVYGYVLPPKGKPSLFELALARKLLSGETLADIRDPLNSWSHCASHKPALVIHMAAQAFVRRSYAGPVEDVGFGIGRRV